MTLVRPEALFLLLLLLPLLWADALGRQSRGARRVSVLVLRTLVLALLALALGRPALLLSEAPLRVVVLDLSPSMGDPVALQAHLDGVLADIPKSEDVALVTFGRNARAVLSSPAGSRRFAPPIARGRGHPGSSVVSALELAASLIRRGRPGSVVLISDGRENLGSVASLAPEWHRRGLRLDVVPAGEPAPEPVLLPVHVPAVAPVGGTLSLEFEVESPADEELEVLLESVAPNAPSRTIALATVAGRGRASRRHEVACVGRNALSVSLRRPGGPVLPESEQVLFFEGLPPVDVLLVEDPAGPSVAPGLQELFAPGFRVVPRAPSDLPSGRDLEAFGAVVVSDVPASLFASGALRELEQAATSGLGVLVAGGARSFGSGGYAGTPLAEMLPIRFVQKEERRDPSATLVIIIDTSGSMMGSRMEIAKEIGRLALARLKPHDKAGIVEFHGAKRWAAPIQPASNAVDLQRALNRLNAQGGTVIFPAIEEAYYGLLNARTRTRHALVITDGGVEQGPFEQLARKMAEHGMTLSTVLAGESASHSRFLVRLAQWGRGRFYHARDRFNLPEVLVKQPESSLLSPFLQGRLDLVGGDVPLLREVLVESLSPIAGVQETEARPTADVLLESAGGKPLLTRWRYGLGLVAAWTTELLGPWTGELAKNPAYSRLLTGLLREQLTVDRDRKPLLEAVVSRSELTVFLVQKPDATRTLRARVSPLGAGSPQEREVPLTPGTVSVRSPGVIFRDLPPGEVLVEVLDAKGVLAQGRVGVPTPREWTRALRCDAALATWARSFGGRSDGALTPLVASGFAVREVWRWCLGAALVAFVAMVFVRRLPGRGGRAIACVALLTLSAAGQEPPEPVAGVLEALELAGREPLSEAGEGAFEAALTKTQRRDGTLDDLVQHLEKDLVRRKGDAAWATILARVLSEAGFPRRGIDILRPFADDARLGLQGLVVLARLLEFDGRDEEALRALDQAIALTPEEGITIALEIRRASILLGRSNDKQRGLESLRKLSGAPASREEMRYYAATLGALHDAPDLLLELPGRDESPEVALRDHLMIGAQHLDRGNLSKAQHHFRRAAHVALLERDRRFALERLMAAHRAQGTLDVLADTWLSEKDRSVPRLDALVALLRELRRVKDALGLLLAGRDEAQGAMSPAAQREIIGLALEGGRDLDVETIYADLIVREPRRLEWRTGLALLYILRGERARAAKSVRDGIDAEVDGSELLRIAEAARELSLDREARAAAEKAVRSSGAVRVRGELLLAEIAFEQGLVDDAEARLTALEDTAKDADEVLLLVANAWERAQRSDRAVRTLEWVVSRPIRDAMALLGRWVLQGEHPAPDPKEAWRRILDRAGERAPEDVVMRLAWLYEERNETERALWIWRRLFESTELPARQRQAEDRILELAGRRGRLADTAIDLEDALDRGDATPRDLLLLVKIYTKVNDPVAAIEVLREHGPRLGRGEVETLEAMARVYRHCDDYRSYEEALKRLQVLDPRNLLEYQRQIVLGALERGRGRRAKRALDELSIMSPNDREAQEFAAGVLAMIELLDESIRTYGRILAAHPDRIEAHLLRANVMVRAGRSEPARKAFLSLLERADRDDLFTIGVDGILNLQASRSELRATLRRIKERIALKPDKAFLYRLAADVEEELENTDGQTSLTALMAIAAGDRRAAILRELMNLAATRHRYEDVIRHGRSLLALGEEMPPQVFLDLGQALVRQGDLATAERIFARRSLDGDFIGMQRQIAAHYEEGGYFAAAERTLRQALLARPDDVELLSEAGRLNDLAGRDPDALRDFTAAMDVLFSRSPVRRGVAPGSRALGAASRGPLFSSGQAGVAPGEDPFEQLAPRITRGIIASLDADGSEYAKLLAARVREELETLVKNSNVGASLPENPRLQRRLELLSAVATSISAWELLDEMVVQVFSVYPKDKSGRREAVQTRLAQGLLVRGRALAIRLGLDAERDFDILRRWRALSSQEGLDEWAANEFSAEEGDALLNALMVLGRRDEARRVLARLDTLMGEPSHDPLMTWRFVTAALALSDDARARSWVFVWVDAVVRRASVHRVTSWLVAGVTAVFPLLFADDPHEIRRRFEAVTAGVVADRRFEIEEAKRRLAKTLGWSVDVPADHYRRALDSASTSPHKLGAVVEAAPMEERAALLSEFLDRAKFTSPHEVLGAVRLIVPGTLNEDLIDRFGNAFREALLGKRIGPDGQAPFVRLLLHERGLDPRLLGRWFSELRERHPDDAAVALGQAALLDGMGKFQEARRLLERGLSLLLSGNSFEWQHQQVLDRLLENSSPQSAALVSRTTEGFMKRSKPPAPAVLLSSELLLREGRLSAAVEVLRSAHARGPDQTEILAQLLRLLSLQGRQAELTEIRSQQLRRKAGDDWAWDMVAQHYHNMGRPLAALDALGRAKTSASIALEVTINLTLGRHDAARGAIRRYLAGPAHAFFSLGGLMWAPPPDPGGLLVRPSRVRADDRVSKKFEGQLCWRLASVPWGRIELERMMRVRSSVSCPMTDAVSVAWARARILSEPRALLIRRLEAVVASLEISGRDAEILFLLGDLEGEGFPRSLVPGLLLVARKELLEGEAPGGFLADYVNILTRVGEVEEARTLIACDLERQLLPSLERRGLSSFWFQGLDAYVATLPAAAREGARAKFLGRIESRGIDHVAAPELCDLIRQWREVGRMDAVDRSIAVLARQANAARAAGAPGARDVQRPLVGILAELGRVDAFREHLGRQVAMGSDDLLRQRVTCQEILPERTTTPDAARRLHAAWSDVVPAEKSLRARRANDLVWAEWLYRQGAADATAALLARHEDRSDLDVTDLLVADLLRECSRLSGAHEIERALHRQQALPAVRYERFLRELSDAHGEEAARTAALEAAAWSDMPAILKRAIEARRAAGPEDAPRDLVERLERVTPRMGTHPAPRR